MGTVVLVLCRLEFHSSLLGIYFLTAESGYSSHVFLGAALIFISIRVARSTFFIFTDHQSEYLVHVGFATHASIVGIAFESGFNSVSSFNVSFKKYIGIILSAFKKAHGETLSGVKVYDFDSLRSKKVHSILFAETCHLRFIV